MTLVVTQFEARGFRSYVDFKLTLDPQLTLLVGPNAVGKTNIIEALQLLSAGESFRRPQWPEVVSWGKERAFIRLHAEGEGRVLDIEMNVGQSGKREYRVNGKTRHRVSEVAGTLPCVLFTPEDLRIVKDSAEKRRVAIDSLGVQLSSSYRSIKTEYERILRQRNSLLRDHPVNEEVLKILTEKIVDVGSTFMAARVRLFDRLNQRMSELYANLSGGECLESRYMPSWGETGEAFLERDIRNHLVMTANERAGQEDSRRTTLFGPHKDDLVFHIEGREARAYSSQGQQRTVTLAWKLAEVGVVKDISGQPPLLLLDDVMSELDESRRHSLAVFVGGAAQTVITTTNIGYFDQQLVKRASVVTLG